MDKKTQNALVVRLNWVLADIQENRLEFAEKEIRALIKEVRQNIVVPF